MKIEGFVPDDSVGWDRAFVMVDGKLLRPEPSQAVFNHSPDGFAWGYAGSGPSQLALAILLEAGFSSDIAVALHSKFKWEFITTLPQLENWSMDINVRKWVNAHLATNDKVYFGD